MYIYIYIHTCIRIYAHTYIPMVSTGAIYGQKLVNAETHHINQVPIASRMGNSLQHPPNSAARSQHPPNSAARSQHPPNSAARSQHPLLCDTRSHPQP